MNKLLGTDWFKKDWHPSEDDLLRYVDGEMPASESAKVKTHLEACWTCRAKTEKIQGAISSFVEYLNVVFTPNVDPPPRSWQTFHAKMNQVVAEVGKRSLLSQWFASLRKFLSARPIARMATATFLVTLFVAFLIVRLGKVPPVSAVLRRAVDAENQRIRVVSKPVVYQKIQLRRRGTTLLQESSVTWEVWNDATSQRFRQRVQDINGRRFIDTQSENFLAGSSKVLADQRPKLQHKSAEVVGNRQPESPTVPLILKELNQIFHTNQMDVRRPLSPGSYESWRQSVPRKSEEVRETNLPGGNRALTLSTTATGPFAVNAIVRAELVVRAEDWHPVEHRFEVQGEDSIRDYELTETAFEILGMNALNPPIFADLTPVPPPVPIPRMRVASTWGSPSAAELIAAEIQARYALHRVKACLGEPISVMRNSIGQVEVGGLVETPERKDVLIAELRGIPLLKVKIQTVAEATIAVASSAQAVMDAEQQNGASSSGDHAIVEVQSKKLPIQDRLERHLLEHRAGPDSKQDESEPTRIRQKIVDLSTQAVSLSDATLTEAWALRRLAEEYHFVKTDDLNPSTRWLLEVMVRDHMTGLRNEVNRSRELLEPVLSLSGSEKVGSVVEKEIGASGSTDARDLTWAAEALRLFATVERIGRLTDHLFAGDNLPGTQENEATRDLWEALSQVDIEFQRLESEISRRFSGRPSLFSLNDQPK